MESTENRFAHLLKPIRELTKNWEIDVASELNDYLEELDEMCITFDGGKIQLNFAEAALLIQGSACIYSKKVELLHSLVYQTLENINNRNKQRNKQAERSEENDADDAASGNDAGGGALFTPLDVDPSENSMRTNGKRTVNVAPLCPDCLIPPEAFEKNKLPLISVKGEVLCSQRDFRMNLYIPGDDDLLVLSLRSESRFNLDSDLYLTKTQREGAGPLVSTDAADSAAEDFVPLDDHNMELDQEPVEHVNRHQAPAESRMIRERRQVEMNKQPTEEVPPAANVWTFHDPYSVVGEEKPLKPGKWYKIPDSLNNGGKKKRKRSYLLQDFRTWFSGTFDPPPHKLKHGPTLTDLNYIYLSTLKDKLKTERKIYKKAGLVVSDEDLRRTFLQLEEVAPQQQGEEPVDDFRHADLLGGGDNDSDNEHEAFPDGIPAAFEGGADFITSDAQRDELTYEDLVKLRVEQVLLNCRSYVQETALSRSVREWQDKIRPKLALLEERPMVDIHEYEDCIVGALNRIGHRRSFASIVHHLENFEACKYLLASLQLANDQTVVIDSKEGLEESLDTMGLTLLSSHRATDRFKSEGFGLKTA